MTDREGRGVDIGDLPGARRLVLVAVGVLFWGWLLARWLHDWVLAPDVTGAAAGALEWLAGGVEFAAFTAASMPALAAGAWITVYLTVLSILLGLVIAVPLAVARIYGGPVLRWIALSYTELIRGTPLLAQLFVLYFGLPTTRYIRDIPGVGEGVVPYAAIWVAVIGFTINSSAYQAEYIRSALQSVDPGQLVAARSVGLSRLEGIRYVVLPQGLRYAIPGWTNELVYLVKYSSLAAFITVPELFRAARNIGSDTFRVLDIYLVAALFYLSLVLTLSVAMRRFEAAVAIPGVGSASERE
ncbi:amino acid ABC transporter permease [Halobacteriales archaeon QH_7_69_31]|nr:MAG: amino acid ABC transporter permease [Halobacteriales archaeon QH_7_69_31]